MKIKRYAAPSMRAALALVRAEQGPDAVILSSRRSEEGIEVIAAVDYDEALFAEAKAQRSAAIMMPPEMPPAAPTGPVAPAASASPMAAPALKAAAAPKAAAPPKVAAVLRAPAAATADGLGAMQRELQDLRRLLESGLAGMTW